MSNVKNILSQRLQQKKGSPSKMAALAKQSSDGNLTSFSGIFSVVELNAQEKAFLENLLHEHSIDPQTLSQDFTALSALTSEVKAINNQAALLHGERIKKAQTILTRYRDGAFTSWLLAAYGNRQTPYNFLQYYEFVEALPKPLRPQLDHMPRQAIYTLASRPAPIEEKQQIIENYRGENKSELLRIIREAFPLKVTDRRRPNIGESAISALAKVHVILSSPQARITKQQKNAILVLIEEIQGLIANERTI